MAPRADRYKWSDSRPLSSHTECEDRRFWTLNPETPPEIKAFGGSKTLPKQGMTGGFWKTRDTNQRKTQRKQTQTKTTQQNPPMSFQPSLYKETRHQPTNPKPTVEHLAC